MTSSTSATDRLDSWKEIAEYVGRDVRTAIRWERDRGLPVHRVPGGRKGAVFAYRGEIEEWLRGGHGDMDRAVASNPPPVVAPPAAPPERRPARPGARRPRTLAGVVAALCVVALGTAAWRVVRRPDASATVERLEFSLRELVARAADGAVLWRYAPGPLIETPVLETGFPPWYAIADVDGDGLREVVATVPLRLEDARVPGQNVAFDELVCLSSSGRVQWKMRLEDQVAFRAGSFGPPWLAGRVVAYRAREGMRIAWSQAHHTWWPSRLVVLDGKGTRLSTFTHAGSIRALHAVEVRGRTYLLAGGVANPYRAAFVAVLDGAAVRGHGPTAAGSPFECSDCGGELPLRYFLFPPSDINRVSGLPYNTIARLVSLPSAIEVYTTESNGTTSPLAEMVFRFSTEFELLDARSSDSFAAHEFFERAGKLDHTAARCPWYRDPPPVREWTSAGWRDIRSAPPSAEAVWPPRPAL